MLTVGILTFSDKAWRGERQDRSGEVVREILSRIGANIAYYDIVPAKKELIAEKLVKWVNEDGVDVILTTGGTGLGLGMLLLRRLFE